MYRNNGCDTVRLSTDACYPGPDTLTGDATPMDDLLVSGTTKVYSSELAISTLCTAHTTVRHTRSDVAVRSWSMVNALLLSMMRLAVKAVTRDMVMGYTSSRRGDEDTTLGHMYLFAEVPS